ncbi:MAG: cupin domain-containing protein [Dehalococcoidales bacterium]
MGIRRVVTGHTPDGKATVVSDTLVEGVTGRPVNMLWGSEETVTFPDNGSPTAFSPTDFPSVGGFRFGVFTVQPQSNTPQAISEREEAWKKTAEHPGKHFHPEPDNPGMHTTDTIDFEYVISGEIWLELDDGEEVHLKAGDTVIQNGTRHAWRNKGTEPCQVVVCIIGAHRK